MQVSRPHLWARIVFVATISAAAGAARAAINEFDVYRIGLFNQNDAISPPTSDGYFFNSRVFMDSDADFDGGTLTYPGPASPVTYSVAGAPGSLFLNFNSNLTLKSTLDTNFPTGAYTAKATNSSTSASQSTAQNYSVDAFSQTTPALNAASYTALQGMNPALPQSVGFNSFTTNSNANESDVFFTITDGSNNELFDAGFLPSGATSVTIPAGTLLPGTNYIYSLDFSGRINSTAPDGVADVQGFDLSTSGAFTTGPVPEPATGALFLLTGMALIPRRPRHHLA